jgi:hypothetical protein
MWQRLFCRKITKNEWRFSLITTNAVAQTNPKLKQNPFRRQPAPSATGAANEFDIMHEVFNFLLDIDDPSAFDAPDAFADFLSDIEYISTHNLSESLHFAKKSDSISRIRARKFYSQNAARIKAKAKKLRDNKAAQKRKEIESKKGRTGEKKRKKKKYPGTKNHVNEMRRKRGARDAVNNLFPITKYRVIRPFFVSEGIEASLYEKIEYEFGHYTLFKRNTGKKIKFDVPKHIIHNFIKLENLTKLEDII